MIRKRVVAKRKNCDNPDKKKPRILLFAALGILLSYCYEMTVLY